jgi:Zn-dependent peptidase ImmA (M78 family)
MARIFVYQNKGRMKQMATTVYSNPNIEERASRILWEYNMFSFPILPEKIADLEGIRLFKAHFSRPNISGLITMKNDEAAIYVSALDPSERQRFTMAHELGHYFIHLREGRGTNFIDSELMLRSGGVKNPIEAEANNFAAALLMPSDEVKELFLSKMPFLDMLKYFYVSRSALTNRLKNLGLRG